MSQTKELITSFRFRQDTLANWNLANPILKDGEFILIKDTAEYKVGNGVSKFSELPVRGLPAVQDKGQSILNVMSQKAVTDELNRLDGVDTAQTSEINSVKSGKVDKSSILSTFPTVEPTDHTTLVSAKEAYKKVKELSDKNTQLEQNLSLFNRKPQGLRFKAGDNTVFAKTVKELVLGTDDFTVCIVANTIGCGDSVSKSLFTGGSNGKMSIYGVTTGNSNINSITAIRFYVDNLGILSINKTDNTTNLHHIVITRSGTLVTCTINGRLVKSVTQDRVLDFSKFIYDIANTSYFWGGAVFNYAMTQAESNKLLWSGGRYDEVRIGDEWRKPTTSNIYDIANNNANGWSIAKSLGGDVIVSGGFMNITQASSNSSSPRLELSNGYWESGLSEFIVEYENVSGAKLSIYSQNVIKEETTITSDGWNRYSVLVKGHSINHNKFWFQSAQTNPSPNPITFKVRKLERRSINCLLEYRPENIREDRYLNSGTMGSDYDLVYSAVKPEIIYEKPYADKVMLDENKAPDWHPIAMGQEVETPTNIFKAKLPDLGKEWQVSDWKQINN